MQQETEEKQKKKSNNGLLALKIFLVVTFLALVLIFAPLVQLFYETSCKITKVAEYQSPDGEYTIVLKEIGEPFSFSGADGVVVLKKDRRRISAYHFGVNNDGGRLNQGNVRLTWREDGVEVLTMGIEDDPDEYEDAILYFDGRVEEMDEMEPKSF